MSRITGLACDNCGILDVEINLRDPMGEDYFPRNGWMSLTQWSGEQKGVLEEDDIHLCSLECLYAFSEKSLMQENTLEEQIQDDD